MSDTFSKAEQEVVYRVIRARRDIRNFTDRPIPDEVLTRILEAAHYAPSVGFMQPWNFIMITDRNIRQQIKDLYDETNAEQSAQLSQNKRKELYQSIKFEAILDAPVNIVVTCDRTRDNPFVPGRGPMPETDLYSTCMAIQNMWLAARAEGIGMCWVSILDRPKVEEILQLPSGVQFVAYLCLGEPVTFHKKPILEEKGWKSRLELQSLVYENRWGQKWKQNQKKD